MTPKIITRDKMATRTKPGSMKRRAEIVPGQNLARALREIAELRRENRRLHRSLRRSREQYLRWRAGAVGAGSDGASEVEVEPHGDGTRSSPVELD